jgi:hypothetical protein
MVEVVEDRHRPVAPRPLDVSESIGNLGRNAFLPLDELGLRLIR